MEGKGKLSMLIGAFLLIVLGAVFVTVLSDQNYLHRNTYRVSNETLGSAANATSTRITNYPVEEILYVTNATGADYVLLTAANYTATTDSVYNMYNGLFFLTAVTGGQSFEGQDLNITYTYYPSGYVRQSTARTILNLIPLFFVIALLLFVVYPIMKKLEWI